MFLLSLFYFCPPFSSMSLPAPHTHWPSTFLWSASFSPCPQCSRCCVLLWCYLDLHMEPHWETKRNGNHLTTPETEIWWAHTLGHDGLQGEVAPLWISAQCTRLEHSAQGLPRSEKIPREGHARVLLAS